MGKWSGAVNQSSGGAFTMTSTEQKGDAEDGAHLVHAVMKYFDPSVQFLAILEVGFLLG